MIFDRIGETGLMEKIPDPLIAWFLKNKREMEWRSNPSPYYVWVSEIMLQQTRIEAVRPYFRRFVEELPDVCALAHCDEERLLKLWEGLGYYNRVRNMQRSADIVTRRYEGKLPSDPMLLRELPGIGNYTAGAIASIAFGLPEPAVDGNVLRVLSRITGSKACIDEPKTRLHFEDLVRGILHGENALDPGIFNQSLMELGALVCVPNGPARCAECPLREFCQAHLTDDVDSIPVRKTRISRKTDNRTVLVVRDATRTVIRKRARRGLLAGLWELPNLDGHLTKEQVLVCAREIGIRPLRITILPDAKHIFSHVEWHMTGYLVLAEDLEGLKEGYVAVEPEMLQREYSIPAAFAGYADYLSISIGQKKYDNGE